MVFDVKMDTTQNFKELIKYATASVFVKPYEKEGYYCPVNLALISPPECGKTRLLGGILCKKTYETMDLSPKNIKERVIPMVEKGEKGVLVITDLIGLLGHKKITSNSTIRFLNALIEEGVQNNDFYGMEFHLEKKVKCGLIFGVTNGEFKEKVYEWNKIGFLHRIIPISYDYSEAKINEIQGLIASGKLFNDINEIAIERNKPTAIKIPDKYSADINILTQRVVERLRKFVIKRARISTKEIDIYFDIKGFRLHDRLRQLARAIAFLDSKGKRKEVNSSDIEKLYSLEHLINFPNSKIMV